MTGYRTLVVALVFVGVVVIGAVVVALHITDTTAERTETAKRLLRLEQLKVSLLRSESTQRAHLLTGDTTYLEQSHQHADDVARHLEALSDSGYSPSTSATDITDLHAAARLRIEVLEEVVATNGSDGPDVAETLIRTRSAVGMDRYFAVSARVEQSESTYLQSLRNQSSVMSQRLLMLLAFGALLNLALLALVYRVMRSDMRIKQGILDHAEKRGGEIAHLNDMNSALLSCSNHAEANGIVRHYIRLLFPKAAGALYLFRASRNMLELQVTWGEPEGTITESILNDECWSLRRGATHLYRNDDDLECEHVDPASKAHYCCVPMMARGETLGMLHAQCNASDADQVHLLETVSTQIASAMANLDLRAALHSQSIKDPLTGLFNRRYLEETMQREELRAARNKSSLSVVMLDLDHFKTFNDSHGHQAGDEVLRLVGDALRDAIRGEDIACRYGGEEFTLILPGAVLEDAAHRAEQVREEIAQLPVRIAGRTLESVSVSLGVATYPDHGENWNHVLQAADAALYRAKKQGRNRVAAAGTATT